jgi:hypothetical protein
MQKFRDFLDRHQANRFVHTSSFGRRVAHSGGAGPALQLQARDGTALHNGLQRPNRLDPAL